MHGFGVFTWGDGKRYEGDYKNGVKHGKGKMSDAKGNNYDGEWKDGKQHGVGSLWDSQGTLNHSGAWFNGSKAVGSIEQTGGIGR